MLSQHALFAFLEHSVLTFPERVAVVEPGKGAITYRELGCLVDRMADRLVHLGVQKGDRVGVYLHKSIDAVGAIFGILKVGAAYVPVDATAPAARNSYILGDCSVRAVIAEEEFVPELLKAFDEDSGTAFFVLETTGDGEGLRRALAQADQRDPAPAASFEPATPDDLAYILYTSGSTGKPKGVMLSHRAAISYVDWCSEVFNPSEQDRFSSHAPFHFDLSILDIYVPLKHGATLVLIDDQVGKMPQRLAPLIAEHRITSWYSTPTILSLLVQYGRLDQYDFSALHTILFAGEVFPVKHLRALKLQLPHPRYFNLYGPTETNVCTYYQIPEEIPLDRTQPYPIGKACSHFRIKVVDEEGMEVPEGEKGELVANGDGMLQGYWNLPERTSQAFFMDDEKQRWYRTGDIVYKDEQGDYVYVGRRDRMVKKRGYRVELGEIESALYRYPGIKEAAVVAVADPDQGVRIKAFLSCWDGAQPSIIEMKQFCTGALPSYMIPDNFSFQPVLPKTSTDKIDYQTLKRMS